MSVLEFGEGTTPKEIHDPDRHPTPPGNPRVSWKVWLSGAAAVGLLLWMNPFVGGESKHLRSSDYFLSPRLGVSYGSHKVYGRSGQHLTVSYEATAKTGSLRLSSTGDPSCPHRPRRSARS